MVQVIGIAANSRTTSLSDPIGPVFYCGSRKDTSSR